MTDAPESKPLATPPKTSPLLKALNFRVLVLITLAVAAWSAYSRLSGHPLEGKPAPAFQLSLLDGGLFDLSEHLGKRPVLLDFWAVWCPPCRDGLPKVAELAKEYSADDMVICAVNLGDAPDAVQNFLNSRSLNVPVALDSQGTVADLYQVRSIPLLVFIDKSGVIKRAHTGSMSADALKTALAALL